MSVVNEINAATSSLKEIRAQRVTDWYHDQLRSLSPFEQRELDNDLAEAMRIIIGIRKDLGNIRLERYLNEQISDKKG